MDFSLAPTDMLHEIFLNMPYDEIINACATDKLFSQICSDKIFWDKKFKADFAFFEEIPDVENYDEENYYEEKEKEKLRVSTWKMLDDAIMSAKVIYVKMIIKNHDIFMDAGVPFHGAKKPHWEDFFENLANLAIKTNHNWEKYFEIFNSISMELDLMRNSSSVPESFRAMRLKSYMKQVFIRKGVTFMLTNYDVDSLISLFGNIDDMVYQYSKKTLQSSAVEILKYTLRYGSSIKDDRFSSRVAQFAGYVVESNNSEDVDILFTINYQYPKVIKNIINSLYKATPAVVDKFINNIYDLSVNSNRLLKKAKLNNKLWLVEKLLKDDRVQDKQNRQNIKIQRKNIKNFENPRAEKPRVGKPRAETVTLQQNDNVLKLVLKIVNSKKVSSGDANRLKFLAKNRKLLIVYETANGDTNQIFINNNTVDKLADAIIYFKDGKEHDTEGTGPTDYMKDFLVNPISNFGIIEYL